MLPFGLYVHYPYCPQKCPYCDFAVKVQADPPAERYTRAVLDELSRRGEPHAGRGARTVYFGGGTPSLWEPRLVAQVLESCARLVGIDAGAEITLEANPGTVDVARLCDYRAAGVNRLSIGAQSFDAPMLASLGRQHRVDDTRRAVGDARSAGFDNLSLDLIYGGPGETVERARRDARAVVALGPEHVALYALNLEPTVPMAREVAAGRLTLPDEDLAADAGDAAVRELAAGGLARYEISGFARPGKESRHNTLYWTGGEYLGLGVGACGYLRTASGARRWMNHRTPEAYMESVEAGRAPEADAEDLTAERLVGERMMTGLRRVAGLDLDALSRELGLDAAARAGPELDRLAGLGLVHRDGPRVALTERGLDLHSEVAARFL